MNKKILLVRHAKAEAESQGQSDFDRELTSTGLSQSYEMGKILAAENISLQLIISSSSSRTKSTAETLAQLTSYPLDKVLFSEEAYNGSMRNLMEIINNLSNEIESVMLVGHNPGISYLSEYLTHESIGDMPTCGIVNVKFENIRWKEISAGSGKLVWFKYPV